MNRDSISHNGALVEQVGRGSRLEVLIAVAFARADRLHNQQRWTVVGAVLLAGALFWLALAEITRERTRGLALVLGLAIFAVGLIWLVGVEVVSALVGMAGL